MRRIFISYRRAEAEYAAGALYRELRQHFGDEQIFRDKEDIEGGVSWKSHLLHSIDRDSALLVLIGRNWANAVDSHGRRRFDNPEDGLRLEITDGIRDGATVFPVLLEDARMPDESELPDDLRRLTDFNALKLRDGDWQHDVENIFRNLERCGFKPVHAAPPSPQPQPATQGGKGIRIKAVIAGVLMLFVLVGLADDDLDRDGHVGAIVLSAISLVLGIMAWRDTRSDEYTGRAVAAVVSVIATLGFFAGIGGMDAAPTSGQTNAAAAPAPLLTQPDSGTARGAPASTPDLRSAAADGFTELSLLRGHARLRYDPRVWKVDKDNATEPGSFQYAHNSGEVYTKIITERFQIELNKLVELGLKNAQAIDPAARVTRSGSRRVNGLDMLFREFEVTAEGIPFTFYAHYYSDRAGAVQLVGWTGRLMIEDHRSTIEEFVSGFEIAAAGR